MKKKRPSSNNALPKNADHTKKSYPPAPLWRRLAAMLYDSLLLIACYMLISFLYTSAVSLTFDKTPDQLSALTLQLTLFPILFFSTLGFFSFFWMKYGRTLGMQTWKLRLINNTPNPVSFSQCTLRICTAILSIACCGLGYLWMLWDKQQRTWQDRASKSSIIHFD